MYDYSRKGISKSRRRHTAGRAIRRVVLTVLKLLFIMLLVIIIGGGIYVNIRVQDIIDDAPGLTGLTATQQEAATYIYNQEGERVQKLTLPEANRDIVLISGVPEDLQHAVVAIEDSRFYVHHGIDPKGILRAVYHGITTGSFNEGASTITQQLLKNTVFPDWTNETTFRERLQRKIQEQYLALKLEKVMSKDQILESYLNVINLGAGCYGVQAAAWRYFGKSVSDLTLSEDAVIAGITQNPSAYNPITNPENNQKRRKMVLDAMLSQGYIDQTRYDEAMADDVYDRIQANESTVDTTSTIYTYYQDALIDQVMEDLQDQLAYTYQQAYSAVYSGGLRIYSAQDDAVQAVCDEEFSNPDNFPAGTLVGIDYALSVQHPDKTITDYGNDDLRSWVRSTSDSSFNLMYATEDEARAGAESFKHSVVGEGDTVLGERVTVTPQPQASCVVIDQSTGYVKALVGGRGNKDASLTLNRASYTTRQPGSTFKILTAYAPAINEKILTLASSIVDEPYNYESGTAVNNADGTYRGEITVREAIIQSVNVIAVKVITQITPQLGYDYAKKFGITTLTDHLETESGVLTDIGQTLALGGISRGVTNLELTGAYGAIANLGQFHIPKFYTKVTDRDGNVILDNTDPKARTVISPDAAQALTGAMEGVISDENGTAYGLINLGQMPAAGKTGTTSDWRDSWFVGYTPYYTCGIWAGYDNNEIMPDEGIYHTFSKTLWNSIMNRLDEGKEIVSFRTSPDAVVMNICGQTHMAASPGCPSWYEETFVSGTQPQFYCSAHGDGGAVYGGSSPAYNSVSPASDISIAGAEGQNETGLDNVTGGAGGNQDAITIYNSDQVTIQPGGTAAGVTDNTYISGEDSAGEDLSVESSYDADSSGENSQGAVYSDQDPADYEDSVSSSSGQEDAGQDGYGSQNDSAIVIIQ